MASLKSTKTICGGPQVPLVISQPLASPITGQSSSGPQALQERPDGPPPDIETEVVLESIQNRSPDLIQSSSHMTSLPVVNDQPIGELPGESLNISEDLPTPEEEPAEDVSVRSILITPPLLTNL